MSQSKRLWEWLFGTARAQKRPVFVRRVRVSGEVREFLFGSACTDEDRMAFAELLLRLDGDPFEHSRAVLPPVPPGLRWAPFGGHRAILVFDPAHDLISVLICE
jgi:hypothetical protein